MDSSEVRSISTYKAIGPTTTMESTACGQNDCEELNITLMAGPNVIDTHHETGLVAGDNTVVFNFPIEENTITDWDKGDFNPRVKVEMKLLAGNYQTNNIVFAPSRRASILHDGDGTDELH